MIAHRASRQEDQEFKANLGYIRNLRQTKLHSKTIKNDRHRGEREQRGEKILNKLMHAYVVLRIVPGPG